MKLAKPGRYTVYAALIAIFIFLRLWGLTSSCLWFDEIFSIHAAEHSWSTVLGFVAQDLIHPPLFYLLLKLWISAGGEGLFWLRLFPVVFAVFAIVPFFLLCRELKLGFFTTALALFLFAVNGSLIKYSQEVRMYAPLLCLSLFSTWLFARFFHTGKWLIPLALLNILMVYTHYFGWLVILSQVTGIAIIRRERLLRIGAMTLVVFAAFMPWIGLIIGAAPAGEKFAQNIGWMQRPGLITLFQFILSLFEPVYFKASSLENASNYLVSLTLFVSLSFAASYYIRNFAAAQQEERRRVYLLLSFIMIPSLLALATSWILPYSVWGTRHLIIVFVPFIVLIAYMVGKVPLKAIRAGTAAAFVALSVIAFGLQAARGTTSYIWCGWEVLATELEQSTEDSADRTQVYVFEDLTAYHFWFALRNSPEKFQVDKLEGLEGLVEDKAYFLPRGFDAVKRFDISEIQGEKFWIAFRDDKSDRSKSPLPALAARGFVAGEPRIFEAGRDKAYLVLIEKQK
jgi:uncharacterized membrane protein